MDSNILIKMQSFNNLNTEITVSNDSLVNIIIPIINDLQLKDINHNELIKELLDRLPDKIILNNLYYFIADHIATKISKNPQYNKLASRIAVERLHKTTPTKFSDVTEILYNNYDKLNKHSPIISKELFDIAHKFHLEIDQIINFDRDYTFDYFGIRTLERSYLSRIHNPNIQSYYDKEKNGQIIERPQHLIMRVALGIHGYDLEKAFETYNLISQKYFTHATPTLFNAGTPKPNFASCFLLGMGDSIEGIFKTITNVAYISKWAGGIGVHLSGIRSAGSIIRGTNGLSDGIVPLCILLNHEARYINQGGKRNGSIAVYLEPWHADIHDFLELRLPNGDETKRARDLFLALWIPDIFMKRVLEKGKWSLMCPDECPGLTTSYGDEFEKLYLEYEAQGKFKKQIDAIDLWNKILQSQIESGLPYMVYKDAANKKSNQKNLGTIRSSNLCVIGSTKILTKDGYQEIGPLEGKFVDVWNGYEWSNVQIRKTGIDQKVMKITFNTIFESTLNSITCTPFHKFYILEQTNNFVLNQVITREVRKDALQLKPGDVIYPFKLPLVTSDNKIDIDYLEMPKEIKVLKIEYINEEHDTYCFTEPIRNRGVFNGILTGQCAEIIEYSDDNEVAVCNLASICLPRFVEDKDGVKTFNFDKLINVAGVVTNNINKIIDINYYSVESAKQSNFKNRPIGVGIQGLADVYNMMGYPFGSPEAMNLNKQIHEALYYGCLKKSNELAKKYGPYDTFATSDFAKGIFQFDYCGIGHNELMLGSKWDELKEEIKNYGTRNSLLTALMPTATTAQIMANSETFEPYMSNIFERSTLAGSYGIINYNLVNDLIKLGIWNEELRQKIVLHKGSVQKIDEIPNHIKEIYKTAFEIKQKDIIQQSIDRGAFIDQSQSLNLFMEKPDNNILSSAHFYGWKNGLKTGMYYLRSKPAADPIQFGIQTTNNSNNDSQDKKQLCKWKPGVKLSDCEACSA